MGGGASELLLLPLLSVAVRPALGSGLDSSHGSRPAGKGREREV